jgi:hypothetical protein
MGIGVVFPHLGWLAVPSNIGAATTGTIAALRFQTPESMSSNSHQRQRSAPRNHPGDRPIAVTTRQRGPDGDVPLTVLLSGNGANLFVIEPVETTRGTPKPGS